MIATAIVAIAASDAALWQCRIGGLSLLTRALAALADAGATHIAVLGGGDAIRAHVRNDRVRAEVVPLPAAADNAAIAEALAQPPGALAIWLRRPFVLTRAMALTLVRRVQAARIEPDLGCVLRLDAGNEETGEETHGDVLVPGAFILPAPDAAAIRRAEDALLATTRKPIEQDGVTAFYVGRPMSRPLTKALLNTSVTPNQVSAVALVIGLASGVFAARAGYLAQVAAALLLFAGTVLDCTDGDLARMTHRRSRLGEWLDTLTDDVSTTAYVAGLGFGIGWLPFGVPPLAVGLATAAAWIAACLYVYVTLVREGGAIDTGRFPYAVPWAAPPAASVTRESAPPPRILQLLARRDSLIALLLFLAVAGVPWVSLLVLAAALGGNALAVALTALTRMIRR